MPILPSTINDIPSSTIRRGRPLTTVEMHDVRSLIGPTTTNATTPLYGRRVMIPVTSRAFFEGELRPPIRRRIRRRRRSARDGGDDDDSGERSTNAAADDDDADHEESSYEYDVDVDDVMDEVVYVNDGGGRLVEMTRAEAMKTALLTLFDDDCDVDRSSANEYCRREEENGISDVGDKGATTMASSTEHGRGMMMGKNNDDTPPPPPSPMLEEEEDGGGVLFPLVEIREICDDDGNVMNAEIVDMSDAMRRLGDDSGDDGRAEEEEEEEEEEGKGEGRRRPSFGKIPIESSNGVEMGDARRAVAQNNRAKKDGISHETHDNDDDDDDAVVVVADDRPSSAVGPTATTTSDDDAYEKIRSRLDELERMEEEDERSRVANRDSSVRLRGGGWSRGFLTKKTAKKTTKKTTKKKEEEEEKTSSSRRAEGCENKEGGERRDEGGTSMAAAPSSSSSSKDGETKSDESRTTTTTTTTRVVSFSGDDTIREIPRIGTSRVPPRPASSTWSSRQAKFDPATANYSATLSGDDDDNVGPVIASSPAVPFQDDDVFRGVVRERTAAATTAVDSVVAARGGGVGKERLSRFARERLQRESRS